MNILRIKKGIGLDIIPIINFVQLLKKDSKSWKIYFTEKELAYCLGKSHPEIHLAARFAGKEAVIKAFTTFGFTLRFNEIEISRKGQKPPEVNILNKKIINYNVIISLSHTTEIAAAVALVEKTK